MKGEFVPLVYDTLSGDIKEIDYELNCGYTCFNYAFYANDSLLLKLIPAISKKFELQKPEEKVLEKHIDFKSAVDYQLEEDNVYLLDRAAFSFDGGATEDEEEILRIDNLIRERLSWPPRQKKIAQPWAEKEGAPEHFISLFFSIESEIALNDAYLAIELSENTEIIWNGKPVSSLGSDYYVDRAITKIKLDKIREGTNTLKVTLPYTRRGSLEWMYLLGKFGVRLRGAEKTVTALPEKIGFGSITHQGFPFYGGNIIYRLPIKTDKEYDLTLKANAYRGALIKASFDDGDAKPIVFAPYECEFTGLSAGTHTLSVKLFGNRHNTFAPIHNANTATYYFGPDSFRSNGDAFGYEYFIKDFGILKSPVISYYKKEK